MQYERQYLTPIFDKDPKFCECEECHGRGFNYVEDSANPEDSQIIKEDCENCNGDGQIQIND